MDIVLTGLCGALGALTRYQLGKFISGKSKSPFPVGTLVINISGAFLLGVVNGLQINPQLMLLLADGFLGAYTTFSAFMYEGVQLFRDNKKWNAAAYIAGSIVIGILGYIAGYGAAAAFTP